MDKMIRCKYCGLLYPESEEHECDIRMLHGYQQGKQAGYLQGLDDGRNEKNKIPDDVINKIEAVVVDALESIETEGSEKIAYSLGYVTSSLQIIQNKIDVYKEFLR